MDIREAAAKDPEKWLFLQESLREETAVFQALLALCERQKDAVIQNDTKTLADIVERQQKLLDELNASSARRRNGMLARWPQTDGRPIRLGELLETAPGAYGIALRAHAARRESAAKALRAAGALNKTLIDTQLQYTSFCINLVTGQGTTPGTYSGAGRVNDDAGINSIMDRSI